MAKTKKSTSKSSSSKTFRSGPFTPKAGLKKQRYGKGGKLK